ncbi:hypothetical protein AB6A40_002464 [Gnathostoma spinigerum]|uniref:G-protein coupled receptors family 1 profile domain-containing protein n=1 Tax=Gnathostoma spinigerum TaxID=75299 RepID=A0ABD6E6N0_9BILA
MVYSSFDGISFNDKEDRRTIHSSLAVLPVSGSKDSKDEQIQTSSFAGRQEDRLQPTGNKLLRIRTFTSGAFSSFVSRVGAPKNAFTPSNQEIANEHKATRVLAVVFGCFFVCWTPFFAANFAVGFCGRACSVPPAIASLFLWLGYGSSTLNPLIYTAFNKRFRQAFLRVLRCQCLLPIRTSEMSRHSRTNIPLDNQTSTFDRSFAMRSSCRSENTYWKTGSCRDFSFPVGSRSVEQSTLHVSNSEVRPLLIWHSEENPSTNLESQKNELQVQVPDTLLSRSSSLIVFHDSENARKPTDRHLLMEKSPSLQQSSAGECKTSGTHSPIGNLSNEIIDECDNSLSPKTQTTDDTDRQNTDAIDQAMDETFV